MERYKDTVTRYHVTALEEEYGFNRGEITLENVPVFAFIKRRLNGLKIPFYADNEDVVFESRKKLDYPCGDNLKDTDNRYLDRPSAKISHDWARKFNPRRTMIINERTYARQNVSDEFRETIRHNIGKKLIDYTRTISINPEEFDQKPVTELTLGEIRGKGLMLHPAAVSGLGQYRPLSPQ